MAQDPTLAEIPRATNGEFLMGAVVFLVLIGGALLIEGWRRRRDRVRRVQAEWRALDALMTEREISPIDRATLKEFLMRRAPKEPFIAATMRHHFDAAVDAELDELTRQGDTSAFEQRGVILRDIRLRLGLDYIPFGQRIESTRDLHMGQAVWVTADVDAGKKGWQPMTVTEVDETKMALAARDGAVTFAEGALVKCRLWRDEDARYVFNAQVLRVTENPELLVLKHTKDLERMQSRAHFRIRHDQAVDINVLSPAVDGDDTNVDKRPVVTRLRGRITSLSGGGIAIVVGSPLPKLVFLRIELPLEQDVQPIPTTARLVESISIGGGRYLLRASFVRMDDETREFITHYVFKHQTQQSGPAITTDTA